jgi:hypothetical protein
MPARLHTTRPRSVRHLAAVAAAPANRVPPALQDHQESPVPTALTVLKAPKGLLARTLHSPRSHTLPPWNAPVLLVPPDPLAPRDPKDHQAPLEPTAKPPVPARRVLLAHQDQLDNQDPTAKTARRVLQDLQASSATFPDPLDPPAHLVPQELQDLPDLQEPQERPPDLALLDPQEMLEKPDQLASLELRVSQARTERLELSDHAPTAHHPGPHQDTKSLDMAYDDPRRLLRISLFIFGNTVYLGKFLLPYSTARISYDSVS